LYDFNISSHHHKKGDFLETKAFSAQEMMRLLKMTMSKTQSIVSITSDSLGFEQQKQP